MQCNVKTHHGLFHTKICAVAQNYEEQTSREQL